MSIKLKWLVENKVFYVQFSEDISFEEMNTVTNAVIEKVEKIPSTIPLIHFVINNSQVTSFPRDINKWNTILKPLYKNPRTGWLVLVSNTNPIIQMIFTVIAQLHNVRHRSFNNIEEVEKFLKHVDIALTDFLMTEV